MAETKITAYRRIVLQMDACTHCRETLHAAIDIAALLGADLKGIFVEDQNLLSVGKLDFVREIGLSSQAARMIDSPTLEAQLKAIANSARRQLQQAASRRKVSVEFQTIRDFFGQEFHEYISRSDLVIMEGTGRFHQKIRRAGQLSYRLDLISDRPTLFLKGGKFLPRRFVLLCDSPATSRRVFSAALALSQSNDRELVLLPCIRKGTRAGTLEKLLDDFAAAYPGTAMKGPVFGQDIEAVLDWLDGESCLVITAINGPLMQSQKNKARLITCRFPLLIV